MVLKLEFTELWQRIESLGVTLLGAQGLAYGGGASGERSPAQALLASYLNNRAATIYGGSSEIQREIVARAVLGT
jgi:alkylation response protein AidB-like acyl-CoA dehydrogenase